MSEQMPLTFEQLKELVKPKFCTPYNRENFPVQKEKNTLPSLTVPDQTMSIKEIMRRFAQGLPMEGEKVPVYDGEENDLPDSRTMDLADIQEMRERIKNDIEEGERALKHYKQQQKPKPKPKPKPDEEEAEVIE